MTREKIKSEVVNLIQESTYQTELNLLAFIDELCDDFESRTCVNCKWYNMNKLANFCDNINSQTTYRKISELDFGCTEFERKDK